MHMQVVHKMVARRPEWDQRENPMASLHIYRAATPVAIPAGIALPDFASKVICNQRGFRGDALDLMPQFHVAQEHEGPHEKEHKQGNAPHGIDLVPHLYHPPRSISNTG